MRFSYNWLQEYFDSPLPPAPKLAELLTMHAFEVEEVRRAGKDALLSVDVLPNRISDAAQYDGMAQEIAAILGKRARMPMLRPKTVAKKTAARIRVRVDARDACSRYAVRIIEGVRVHTSPRWLSERLRASGLRPINAVVDAANYMMLKTGQPMHVFDYERIGALSEKTSAREDGQAKERPKTLVVRYARRGETFTSLEKAKPYALQPSMLLISDETDAPLALAGIKGGKDAEVSARTTTIVLEAAQFSGPLLRRTSRALGLTTDAAVRFAHGVDPNAIPRALDELAALVQQLAGGAALSGIADAYPRPAKPQMIPLRAAKLAAVLGTDIPAATVRALMRRLGFALQPLSGASKGWMVRVPTRRPDIEVEENLIEEVGRLFGYERIAARGIAISAAQEDDPLYMWSMRIRQHLARLGFSELLSYNMVGAAELRRMGMPDDNAVLELANPTRPELRYMRPVLAFGALAAIQKNQEHAPRMQVAEIGHVFCKSRLGAATPGVFETPHVVFALAERGASAELFFELKGMLSALCASLGLGTRVRVDDAAASAGEPCGMARSLMHPYRSGEVRIGNDALGQIGELHPEIARDMKLKHRVVFCELSLARLAALQTRELEYRPIARYPALVRDCAVLVPQQTRVAEVLGALETAGGALLSSADLFDAYEGRELPKGKKNLAFHLMFQSSERTLKDKEVDDIMSRMMQALEERPEWKVRR